MDALRAATPFVVVAVPSKTSLDRRRVVVDEDAVETSDDAARRRNMVAREKHGRTRRARDAGVAVVFSRARRLFARRRVLGRVLGYRPLGQNLESRTVKCDVRM